MSHTSSRANNITATTEILEFISNSSGLSVINKDSKSNLICIVQKIDQKQLQLNLDGVEEVIQRKDFDGKTFKQINFKPGRKILLTDSLIGFKPGIITGLELSRLPKVVTTPDLHSVLEAIQDVLSSDISQEIEIEILRKVFQSILMGAKKVGFDMDNERKTLESLPFPRYKMVA